ncbi:MAG TPA: hypothetical protein ENF57_03960 [Candidatus Korarchaeota archaeon]|nr:hypothetical protein [Candidatus Korarchaeota archaeon]
MPARAPSELIKRAARLLLFRSGMKPGVKGWELAKVLGKDYLEVIKALNERLKELGLEVVAVNDKGKRLKLEGGKELRKATFLVVLRGPISLQEAKTSGWRIDDLAMLSVSLLYLLAKGGSAQYKELLEVLKSKFKGPRVEYVLGKMLRMGYLEQDGDTVKIGWRSRVEIDLDKLMDVEVESGAE